MDQAWDIMSKEVQDNVDRDSEKLRSHKHKGNAYSFALDPPQHNCMMNYEFIEHTGNYPPFGTWLDLIFTPCLPERERQDNVLHTIVNYFLCQNPPPPLSSSSIFKPFRDIDGPINDSLILACSPCILTFEVCAFVFYCL